MTEDIPEDPKARARRLHVEAQQRYIKKIRKRGVPTAEAVIRAIAKASLTATAPHFVNNGGPLPKGAPTTAKEAFGEIMLIAVRSLVTAGYDNDHVRAKVRSLINEEMLQYLAKQAATLDEQDDDCQTFTPMP